MEAATRACQAHVSSADVSLVRALPDASSCAHCLSDSLLCFRLSLTSRAMSSVATCSRPPLCPPPLSVAANGRATACKS